MLRYRWLIALHNHMLHSGGLFNMLRANTSRATAAMDANQGMELPAQQRGQLRSRQLVEAALAAMLEEPKRAT